MFGLFFPDDCRVCGAPLEGFSRIPVCDSCLRPPAPVSGGHFCRRCYTAFLNASPLNSDGLCRLCAAGITAFDAAWSCGHYEGPLRELIHLYKFGRMMPLARYFGRYLARALPRDQRFDAIVPVPLHWRRRFRRGFDQSVLLARELERRTGIPALQALRRTRYTRAQAGLSRRERSANVAQAFSAPAPEAVRGRRLLVVDDVFTTGVTANAAAAALKRAGAARVCILTLARADRLQPLRLAPAETASLSPPEESAHEYAD